MRIHKSRFYILADHPGISGFQQWDKLEYRLVTGHKAATYRCKIVGEWLPTDSDNWALEDGHVQGYQPIARNIEAVLWLQANPFQAARYVQTTPPQPYFATDPTRLIPRVVTCRTIAQDAKNRSIYVPCQLEPRP